MIPPLAPRLKKIAVIVLDRVMIFLLLLTRVTVLAHVMVLTCNMALISVMVLTNAMVAIRVFC